jgi:outer membrane lipoprotein SlyB
MHRRFIASAALLVSAALPVAGCGGHKDPNTSTATGEVAPPSSAIPAGTSPTVSAAPAPAPHSKVKGAIVGAAIGHVLGGHAMAGAAAGAIIQHERNKRP